MWSRPPSGGNGNQSKGPEGKGRQLGGGREPWTPGHIYVNLYTYVYIYIYDISISIYIYRYMHVHIYMLNICIYICAAYICGEFICGEYIYIYILVDLLIALRTRYDTYFQETDNKSNT